MSVNFFIDRPVFSWVIAIVIFPLAVIGLPWLHTWGSGRFGASRGDDTPNEGVSARCARG